MFSEEHNTLDEALDSMVGVHSFEDVTLRVNSSGKYEVSPVPYQSNPFFNLGGGDSEVLSRSPLQPSDEYPESRSFFTEYASDAISAVIDYSTVKFCYVKVMEMGYYEYEEAGWVLETSLV